MDTPRGITPPESFVMDMRRFTTNLYNRLSPPFFTPGLPSLDDFVDRVKTLVELNVDARTTSIALKIAYIIAVTKDIFARYYEMHPISVTVHPTDTVTVRPTDNDILSAADRLYTQRSDCKKTLPPRRPSPLPLKLPPRPPTRNPNAIRTLRVIQGSMDTSTNTAQPPQSPPVTTSSTQPTLTSSPSSVALPNAVSLQDEVYVTDMTHLSPTQNQQSTQNHQRVTSGGPPVDTDSVNIRTSPAPSLTYLQELPVQGRNCCIIL